MRAPSTRCIARKIAPQWRPASSSSRSPPPPLRQAAKGPAPEPRVVRPYKPTTPANSKSKSSSTPPPPGDTLLHHWRTSWLPLSGAALLAGSLGFYLFGTATASLKRSSSPSSSSSSSSCKGPCEHTSPTGRPPALTGDNAEKFDKELNLPEWWMGVTSLRSRLAREAKGHVLEVAMGSGRNLEYYDWDDLSAAAEAARSHTRRRIPRRGGISSFTGLDISPDMLDVSRRKLTRSVPPMSSLAPVVKASSLANGKLAGGTLSFLDGHLRLITADAHDPLPPPSRADKYDTITQSFGLCSVSDPVAVLANLAAALRPDTGRILLLEHGKGWYGIVNGLLDKNADKHFAKYGCWWNRDIEAIVEEAAERTPGLEVVKLERPNITQMGTLVWVELRVVTDKQKTG